MAIERDKILDAALELLAETGLDGLTTRKLAERLGVQQPALYWHFKNKGDLLDALNERILERYHAHRVPDPDETWQQFARANARSFRKALLSARDGARINAGTRPSTAQFADAERQLQLYVDAGFDVEQAFHLSVVIARFVVGFVYEEQGERERDLADAVAPPQGSDPFDEVRPYPLLSAALEPLFAAGTIHTEAAFETGLSFLIDGAAQSLARSLA